MSIRFISVVATLSILCFARLAFAQGATQVVISDQRNAESLEGRRDSNFSAIAFLPERSVKPAPVAQLQEAIAKRGSNPISLVISEMLVIDYFPKRIKAGPAGWLTNQIMRDLVDSKTDWSFVQGLGISNEQDSVICILAGTVNGKDIKVAAHAPYTLGGFSMMVRSDKNFKAAVTSSIDQVAQKVIEHSTATQVVQ